MILGYRYARRKFREREARRQAEELQQSQDRPGESTAPRPSALAGGFVQQGAKGGTIPSSAPVSTTRQAENSAATHTAIPEKGFKTLTSQEKAEQHRRRSYRWKVVFGLFAPFTLQALDTTIVAAALPTIAVEFSECLSPPSPNHTQERQRRAR